MTPDRAIAATVAALAALLALRSCATAHQVEPIRPPPEQYRGAVTLTLHVVSPEQVAIECARRGAQAVAMACAQQVPPPLSTAGHDGVSRGWVVIGDPCEYGGWYAALLCHEFGHVHGWPADHRETTGAWVEVVTHE